MITGLGYSAPDDWSVPFAYSCGPHDAKMIVVLEAWGESEERTGIPLAGASGREFGRMMIEAGYDDDGSLARALAQRGEREWLSLREEWLERQDIMFTNTFTLRPSANNLGHLCAGRAEVNSDYVWPQVRNENPRYVRPEFFPHVARLAREINAYPRNLVLLLGGTASWAVLGTHFIGRVRGACAHSAQSAPCAIAGVKVLPTYHPASVFRNWTNRVIVLADLIKARREAQFAEVRRPARRVRINPSTQDMADWIARFFVETPALLAADIETHNGQIRCVGFARARDEALVIPFIRDKSGASYWANSDEEYIAWNCARALLESEVPKVFQNGLFDLQYLSRVGIRPRALLHDTMLLHHVLYPELPKNLAFLGSIYTNEAAWKIMRKHKGEEELKRDE
jgi:uracil-DNA glycosylase